MADAKSHLDMIGRIHEQHFGTAEEAALAKRLAVEKVRASITMAEAYAHAQMPADILERARAWRMEAFMTVLWNNAFHAGYRQAIRDRNEKAARGWRDDE